MIFGLKVILYNNNFIYIIRLIQIFRFNGPDFNFVNITNYEVPFLFYCKKLFT